MLCSPSPERPFAWGAMAKDWSTQVVNKIPNTRTFGVPFCVPPTVPPTPQGRGTVLHTAPSPRIVELSRVFAGAPSITSSARGSIDGTASPSAFAGIYDELKIGYLFNAPVPRCTGPNGAQGRP